MGDERDELAAARRHCDEILRRCRHSDDYCTAQEAMAAEISEVVEIASGVGGPCVGVTLEPVGGSIGLMVGSTSLEGLVRRAGMASIAERLGAARATGAWADFARAACEALEPDGVDAGPRLCPETPGPGAA